MRKGTFNRFYFLDSSSESNTTVQNYSAASQSVTSESGISLALAGPVSPNSLSLTSAFAPITVGVGDSAIKGVGEQLAQLTSKIGAGGISGSLAGIFGLNSTTIRWIVYGVIGIIGLKIILGKS